jgi:hypothetical protein
MSKLGLTVKSKMEKLVNESLGQLEEDNADPDA